MDVPAIPPDPPTPQPFVFTSTIFSTPITDTIGPGTDITLEDWLKTTVNARIDNQDTAFNTQQTSAQALRKIYIDYVQRASALIALYTQMAQQLAAWAQARIQQQAISTVISTYNSNTLPSLVTATNDLNTAITNYNGIVPPTTQSQNDLNAAIATYQSAVGNPVNNYNLQINNYNTYIQGVASLPGMPNLNTGLAPLSPVPTVITSTNPPMSTLSTPASLPNITVLSPAPTLSQAFALYFTPVSQSVLQQISESLTREAIQNLFSELEAALNPLNASLPQGASSSIRLRGFTNEGPSFGTSGALIAGIINPGDANFEATASNALYSSLLVQEQNTYLADDIVRLRLLRAQGIQNAVTNAAADVSRQIASLNIPASGVDTFVNVSSAFSFADNLLQSVTSGATRAGVEALVSQSPSFSDLSQTQKDDLVNRLTTAFNLDLLNTGLSQIAIATQSPGLIPQLFSAAFRNTPELADQAANVATLSPSGSFREVLLNPNSVAAIKSASVDELVNSGIVQSRATELTDQAFASTFARLDYTDSESFAQSLSTSFTNLGVSPQLAKIAGQSTVPVIEEERQFPYLDRVFRGETISTLSDALKSGITSATNAAFPFGTSSRVALEAVVKSSQATPAIGTSLTAALSSGAITNRDFLGAFRSQLETNGVGAPQIATASTAVLQLLQPPSAEGNPLKALGAAFTPTSFGSVVEALNSSLATLTPIIGSSGVRTIQAHSQKTLQNLLEGFNEQIRVLRDISRTEAVQHDESNQEVAKNAIIDSLNGLVQSVSNPTFRDFLAAKLVTLGVKSQVETVLATTQPATQADVRTRTRKGPTPTEGGRGWIDLPV